MTNAFIEACLSLIETIRQKWNARFRGGFSSKGSNDENDDEILKQRQKQQAYPSVLDESYTEDEEENEIPIYSSQYIYKRETKQPAKDEYVYRLLRFTENYKEGLRPKNLYSSTSLEHHVERGSRGLQSRYISCCKTMSALRSLGSITNEFQRVREVVRINISKLDRNAVKVIDLTDYNVRRLHISSYSSAWGYAGRFDEVILDPTTHVPKECVERIGIVHYRSFIKDDHVELY